MVPRDAVSAQPPRALDWPALMRLGLHQMGLTPDVFWALTPAELQLIVGPSQGQGPLLAGGLADLMAAYPDPQRPKEREHE